MAQPLGTHPFGTAATRQLVIGIAIAAISVLSMFVGSPGARGVGVTFAVLGGVLAYFGAYSRRQTEAVLLNKAWQRSVARCVRW